MQAIIVYRELWAAICVIMLLVDEQAEIFTVSVSPLLPESYDVSARLRI
jgi:hypothetical protein